MLSAWISIALKWFMSEGSSRAIASVLWKGAGAAAVSAAAAEAQEVAKRAGEAEAPSPSGALVVFGRGFGGKFSIHQMQQ